jgi:hypothetical protein
LFSPLFRGVYCDRDLTVRAFLHGVIIDGREVRFEHRHASCDNNVTASLSEGRVNQPKEYQDGLTAFAASWTRRQREGPRLLLRVKPTQQLSERRLLVTRHAYKVVSTCLYPLKRGRAGFLKAQRILGIRRDAL